MALTERFENRSIRVSSTNEEGAEVLTLSGSYGSQGINLSIEMLDQAYCDAHKADVEQSITSFLNRFNDVLNSDGLPQVKSD